MVKFLIFLAMVLIVLVIMIAISYIASYYEYKRWNNGICPVCGKEMKQFDTDSQGGEGWTCKCCDYTTWVSYHRLVYKFWRNKFKNTTYDKK